MKFALWNDNTKTLLAIFEHSNPVMAKLLAKESLVVSFSHMGAPVFIDVAGDLDAIAPNGVRYAIRPYKDEADRRYLYSHPVALKI